MNYATVTVLYVAFGVGFAVELLTDNRVSKDWSRTKKVLVAVVVGTFWPIFLSLKIGMAAANL